MPAITTRAELESRLRATATRLVARQVARALFSGLAGAAVALGLAVVFLDALPRLLFSFSAGTWILVLAAAAGLVCGVVWEWRRYRIPSLQDAALALEARLDSDSGALAAALRVAEDDNFYKPLLAHAADDLGRAERASAPNLISTRKLVLVPLLALAAGVAFAVVAGASPPTGRPPLAVAAPADNRAAWSNIDIGGNRSQADRDAYRKALGMKETAAKLNQSARTLRDANAGRDAKQQALEDARNAIGKADGDSTGLTSAQLPDELPADQVQQSKLAEKLDAAATALGARADKLKGVKGGSEDSGENGGFKTDNATRELVPLPAVALHATPLTGDALATQTPSRRAMAERAIKALERIQDR